MRGLILLLTLVWLAPLSAGAEPAGDSPLNDQMVMVNRAVTTVERLRADGNMAHTLADVLPRSRAVLIIPDLVKAGFFLGGQYGTGILLARGADGRWSGPAFYSIAAGSFGLQAGVQDAEVMYVIMTDGGLAAVVENRFKAGASAGIALAAFGAGAEAATTTNVGADIYAFSYAAGLYGGLTLDGAAVLPRHSWNAAYYARTPTPEDILFARAVDNRQADRLRDLLAR